MKYKVPQDVTGDQPYWSSCENIQKQRFIGYTISEKENVSRRGSEFRRPDSVSYQSHGSGVRQGIKALDQPCTTAVRPQALV